MIIKNKLEIEKKFLLRENGIYYYKNCVFIDFLIDYVNCGYIVEQGYLSEEVGNCLMEELNITSDFEINEYRLRSEFREYTINRSINYLTLKGRGDLVRPEINIKLLDSKCFNEFWPHTEGRRIRKQTISHISFSPSGHPSFELSNYLNRDLVIAEFEVDTIEEANSIEFIGKDITNNFEYKNINLGK